MAAMSGDGAARAAAAVLQMHADTTIALRVPTAAASGDDAEQLGLASVGYSDEPLCPAVMQRAGGGDEVLVGAEALTTIAAGLGMAEVEALLEGSMGVVIGGELRLVLAASEVRGGDTAIAWRVRLHAAQPAASGTAA